MIIANWKMNGSKDLIRTWIKKVSQNIVIDQRKECIFCPPTCYLDFSKSIIKQEINGIKLGAQQLDSELSAPLTGGIDSEMLFEIGCEFVIIGHSEQRIHTNETNELLSDKLQMAESNNLKSIFCIGETLQEMKNNHTEKILLKQLEALSISALDQCIIAYEPVWAIGTGENADISYIEEIHSLIKEEVSSKKSCKNISVVYGGSVNLDNYKEIYSSKYVDGLLIGGASLDPNTFTRIYNTS